MAIERPPVASEEQAEPLSASRAASRQGIRFGQSRV